ncbi:hypothetical protein [Salinisphaera sp.]|uniref:hypothetical protein n=1 Tax=Salinisphaera sp. TaxID=1914330 RepID=UPI002D791656|nr:hypothetical protein [Salinisphaera sp.]HET7313806.1 hypothetical protein [Salinisphaera sp.]
MADDNLVLEQLRIMRNEIREFRTDTGDRFDRLETRMSSMKHMLGHMYAATADDRAAVQQLARRVERIERRLELRDDA